MSEQPKRTPSERTLTAVAELVAVMRAVEPEHLERYADEIRAYALPLLDLEPAEGMTGRGWSAVVMTHVAATLNAVADDKRAAG